MVREPSKFMLVNVHISVPTNDLLAVSDISFTNFVHSLAFSVLRIVEFLLKSLA